MAADGETSSERRFWPKVDKSGDCWLWTASTNENGYGQFKADGRMVKAHRFAYELMAGRIPIDRELDHRHTCPKRCVNPDHLRLVTRKQNNENLAGPHRGSISGVRGVTWRKDNCKWQARVGHNGQDVHVGYFDSIEEAEAAVIAKRLELFTHSDMDQRS